MASKFIVGGTWVLNLDMLVIRIRAFGICDRKNWACSRGLARFQAKRNPAQNDIDAERERTCA